MSNEVKAARLASRVTIKEMAGNLGVSKGTIIRLENDQGAMKLSQLHAWYQACTDEGRLLLKKYVEDNIIKAS